MKQNKQHFLSPFDIPYNPYVRATLSIHRFKDLCNDIGEEGIQAVFGIEANNDPGKEMIKHMFHRSLEIQKEAKRFLKQEGLMNPDETFSEIFAPNNPNPLIADAAYYFGNL